MKILRLIFLLLFFAACQQAVMAQNIPPAQQAMALQELQKRGITEAEFRAKMKEKGVDIDNVKPEQLPQLEPVIRQAVAELEAEKKQKAQAAPPPDATKIAAEQAKVAEEALKDQTEQVVEEKASEVAADHAEEIQKAVEEGATVEEAIGEELAEAAKEDAPTPKIYGQDIFRKQSIQLYKTVKDIKPPDTYVLGAGDEISVSIWGASSGDFTFEINEQGYIAPTGMPRIFLKGITYGKAKSLVRSRFSRFYVFQPEQFALTINSARTITVNIFGEVLNYGSFTISAVNTAFNALVAAGGPSDIGTLRNIQLIRNGKTQPVDVYQFLFDPKVQYNLFLENNDILFVPVAERVVSIQGAIRRPFRYELTTGEDLMQLIDYAGGLPVNAYKKSIQVERFSGGEKVLMDIGLQKLIDGNDDFTLQNGDVIRIRTIPGRLENFAEITGSVEFPGSYDLSDSMRVSDLLAKGVLKKETRTDLAFLLRVMPDKTNRLVKLDPGSILAHPGSEEDLLLQPKDKLTTYALSRFIDRATIAVTGAVRNPVEHPFDPEESIRVQDLILLAGGLKQDVARYGYIKRTDLTNPQNKDYIRVDIEEALRDPASAANLVLKPNDVLQVFSKSRFSDASSVQVSGAVRAGGAFDYDSTFTVSDVIYLAGGLKPSAARYGYIRRTDLSNPLLKEYVRVDLSGALDNPASAENAVLQPADALVVYDRTRFTDATDVVVTGALREPGQFNYDQNLRLSDVIYLAGGLTRDATDFGYLIHTDFNNPKEKEYQRVDVKAVIENPGSPEDFFLLPFDRLEVMSLATFTDVFSINVAGAVRNPGKFEFDETLTVHDVLTLAGGLKLEAAANRIDVSRVVITENQPTQTVVATLQVDENYNPVGGDFTLQPFDQIVVRTVPEFELQQTVTLNGEVKYPGVYALTSKNEKLASIVKRAGGLTAEAFPKGARFYRTEDNLGVVIAKLNRALHNKRSHYNYVLKTGDIITIPKAKDLVTINLGATLAAQLYPEKMLTGSQLSVAHKGGKRAGWYLRQYAGGINRGVRARKKLITVEHPNGELRRTRGIIFLRFTPKARKGTVVSVGTKPEKPEKPERQKREKEPVDVNSMVTTFLGLATTALTVIVLAKQL
jgi:protein involved in polysaccharide export with SLBB domain